MVVTKLNKAPINNVVAKPVLRPQGNLELVRPRVIVVRCGDDDRFDRCKSERYKLTPLQHMASIYDICYQHTEAGCCLCMNGSKRFKWQDPEHLYSTLSFILALKNQERRISYICLMSHSHCGAYRSSYGEMGEKKELEVHTADLDFAKRALQQAFFGQELAPDKFLTFFLDRRHMIRPIGNETEFIHNAYLQTTLTGKKRVC